MPEGDTIHNHAALLRPLLVGRTLVAAFEHGIARGSLVGREVLSVEAQGKHLVIQLAGGAAIHAHLGMYGRIHRRPAGAVDPKRNASAALLLKTADAAVLFQRPRTVEILRSAFLHAHPALSRLGPDLIREETRAKASEAGVPDEDAELSTIVARARARQSDRAIGELLLDQRVAAGIGNVYKSEVLFLERVDPFAAAAALDDETLARLYARARQLLAHNLGRWRRTTTADRSRGRIPPRGMGRHHVYRRLHRPCYKCGTPIASRPQGEAQRMTYYCPSCQRPRG